MMHGYLSHFTNPEQVTVYSAGIATQELNPLAVAIMQEDGIDISKHTSNNVEEFLDIPFDYLITVCDNAKERCPFFPAQVVKLHHNFPDPSKVKGSTTVIIEEFRKVRGMIKDYCKDFVAAYKL
jgi:arsenate reductase